MHSSQVRSIIILILEWIFNCNTRYLTNAYGNKTYNYRYSIRPSIHAADLFLTFLDLKFDWRGKRRLMHFPYAEAWQSYLISFIKHGDPNIERRPETIHWGVAGEDIKIVDLRWEGFSWKVDDQVDQGRCGFWQRADYAPIWNSSISRNLYH
jgi:carboxylesterase type B